MSRRILRQLRRLPSRKLRTRRAALDALAGVPPTWRFSLHVNSVAVAGHVRVVVWSAASAVWQRQR